MLSLLWRYDIRIRIAVPYDIAVMVAMTSMSGSNDFAHLNYDIRVMPGAICPELAHMHRACQSSRVGGYPSHTKPQIKNKNKIRTHPDDEHDRVTRNQRI